MTDARPSSSAVDRLIRRLSRPVDAASLGMLRALLGVIVAVGTARFVAEGWVTTLFVEPTFFFKYRLFEWVPVWPAWGMYLHYAALGAVALLLALGWRARLMALLLFVGFTFVELMDVTNYLNHYYLISLLALVLAVTPSGRALSLDARRRGGPQTIPTWALWLARFQVGVVYVGAALAKVGPDWLLHGQPLGLWLIARDEIPLLGQVASLEHGPLLMSWGGFLYDLTIVPLLLWRRTRPLAYLAVVGFHGATWALFDIGLFPFVMTAATPIFFDPDWPRRLWARARAAAGGLAAQGPGGWGEDRAGSSPAPGQPLPRWGLALLAVFVLIQVGLPLRHLAIPGDVLWNEAGMRWSWKVMVREKSGAVTYRVTLKDSGRTVHVSPTRYLTWRQANEMSGQPDLILQLAHHIERDFRDRGLGETEVRVDARVSLNGRAPRPMIDPQLDLTAVEDSFWAPSYVLPGPTDPPIRVRAPSAVAERGIRP